MSSTAADGPNNSTSVVKVLIGPALFFLCLFLPEFGPIEARAGFGIMFWLGYYWVSGAVPIKYTILVPLLAVGLVPVLPLGQVVLSYVDKLVILIAAMGVISATWVRWGLARRVALNVLILSGNSVRNQVTIWFVLATLVSMVVADTITAVAFAPIAASVLAASGFETVDSRWKSFAASNVLIALAWGSSHGGFTTPLGGGQALVVYALLGKELGTTIPFINWTIRTAIPTVFIGIFIVAFMRWGMKYEVERFPGTRDVYREELKKLGPMQRGELISLLGFAFAILVAFMEPLYKNILPVKIEPTMIFFLVAMALFFIPADKGGGRVLDEDTVKKHFPYTAVIVWPTAIALANILEFSGAVDVMGQWLAPLAQASPGVALAGFTGLAGLMTQFSTNTAANAIVVPVALQTVKSTGQNIIPWVYATGMMGSLGYAVASSSGGIAVVVAYGANMGRMFTNGMIAFFIAWIANWVFWYVVMFIIKWGFYLTT